MSEMQVRDYLPRLLRDYLELRVLADSQQAALDRAWSAQLALLEGQFLDTAGEACISRWEKILELYPGSGDSLEERRFAVRLRLRERTPFTVTALRRALESLCGKGRYEVSLRDYTLTVRVALSARGSYAAAASLLERMCPANIRRELSLLYNTHGSWGRFTHAQMALRSHYGLRNEEIEE